MDDADRLDGHDRCAAVALDDRRVDELERAVLGVDVVDVEVRGEDDGRRQAAAERPGVLLDVLEVARVTQAARLHRALA